MQQYLIPPSEIIRCEDCHKIIPNDMATKSQRRCNGHNFCFTHQMFYTSRRYRSKRLAKQSIKTRSANLTA